MNIVPQANDKNQEWNISRPSMPRGAFHQAKKSGYFLVFFSYLVCCRGKVMWRSFSTYHDAPVTGKCFTHYWPFVRGTSGRSPVYSLHNELVIVSVSWSSYVIFITPRTRNKFSHMNFHRAGDVKLFLQSYTGIEMTAYQHCPHKHPGFLYERTTSQISLNNISNLMGV